MNLVLAVTCEQSRHQPNLSLRSSLAMAAPMKQKLQIKFCIYCPESKLKETAKKRYCSSCHHKKKENDSNVKAFNIPKETTLENLDLELIKDMKYCLYCGEELIEDEGSLICIDGCGNLNITKG